MSDIQTAVAGDLKKVMGDFERVFSREYDMTWIEDAPEVDPVRTWALKYAAKCREAGR